MPTKQLTFDEKREMVWEDYGAGRISQERADEMLRVIGEHEAAEFFAAGQKPPLPGATVPFDEAKFAEAVAREREIGEANLPRYLPGGWCECPASSGSFYWQRPDGSHGWACDDCGRLTQSG